jgi:hypothetical protein
MGCPPGFTGVSPAMPCRPTHGKAGGGRGLCQIVTMWIVLQGRKNLQSGSAARRWPVRRDRMCIPRDELRLRRRQRSNIGTNPRTTVPGLSIPAIRGSANFPSPLHLKTGKHQAWRASRTHFARKGPPVLAIGSIRGGLRAPHFGPRRNGGEPPHGTVTAAAPPRSCSIRCPGGAPH